MHIDVMAPTEEHEAGWRSLWDRYCDGAIEQRVSDATLTRPIDPASAFAGLVTVSGGEVIGFVNYVVHEGTWETKPICYVEEAFVSKLYRRRGSLVARAMADQLVQRVRSGEWSRLWGITASDNLIAQRLYSGFAEGRPYVRYVMRGCQ
jgi:GNAT superfamily N-acetyltransferase